MIFNNKISNLNDKNITAYVVKDNNEIHLDIKIESFEQKKTTAFWIINIEMSNDIDVAANEIIFIKFIDQIDLLSKEDKVIEDIRQNLIYDINNKKLVSSNAYKLSLRELNDDKIVYEPIEKADKYTSELNKIIEVQMKVIKELLELEPHNRFAHSEQIYLLVQFKEKLSNTLKDIEERVNITEQILVSACDLKSNNQRLQNRFNSLFNFYSLK